MKLEWKTSWEDWGVVPEMDEEVVRTLDFSGGEDWDVVPELDVSYRRNTQGYDVYSDNDGLYLFLEDMDGNVGRFDAGDTPYEDFDEWVALAFSQIEIS